MYLDGIISMIIYTLATSAFYILGAAILHSQGLIPAGYELIQTLSCLYTDILGPRAMWVFLAGAFMTLYSTLFVACASAARMYTDAVSIFARFNYSDSRLRMRWIRIFACILPVLWGGLYLFFKSPVVMVMMGGIALIVLLLLVAFAALLFRYSWLKPELKPGKLYDFFLWISVLTILGLVVYTLFGL